MYMIYMMIVVRLLCDWSYRFSAATCLWLQFFPPADLYFQSSVSNWTYFCLISSSIINVLHSKYGILRLSVIKCRYKQKGPPSAGGPW